MTKTPEKRSISLVEKYRPQRIADCVLLPEDRATLVVVHRQAIRPPLSVRGATRRGQNVGRHGVIQ